MTRDSRPQGSADLHRVRVRVVTATCDICRVCWFVDSAQIRPKTSTPSYQAGSEHPLYPPVLSCCVRYTAVLYLMHFCCLLHPCTATTAYCSIGYCLLLHFPACILTYCLLHIAKLPIAHC